jgi:hypothetical protein
MEHPRPSVLQTDLTSLAPARSTPARATSVGLEVDQLAAHASADQTVDHVAGEIRGQIHEGEVGEDLDVPEVFAAQATLVGDRAHDLARLHFVTLADIDAVGGERTVAGARATFRAVAAAAAISAI